MYRAAVIGLGVMGQVADGLGGRHPMWFRPCSHADAYFLHPRTELVAGATRDAGRQARFRKTYPEAAVYSDYREMLVDVRPDIVSIATPATCHAEMVIEAARAGVKGIYCEKAMASSLAECDAMLDACERAGTVLAIHHQRRWDDRFRALKRLLGEVGDLQAIQVSFGGGRLCRMGSHLFDLALFFCGSAVARGCGWLSDADAFDPGGFGIFEMESGVRVVVDGCVGMEHPFRMDLIGERGMFRVLDGGFRFERWHLDAESGFGMMVQRHLPMNFPVRSPMLNALDDVISCIETGGQPASSGADGRAAFEMIAGIHTSHRRNRAFVEFPLQDRGLRVESN